MTIEKKTLAYEVLIRFSQGAEHQSSKDLGKFEGAHYIDAVAVVDTTTNEVISYRLNAPKVLLQDQIDTYLKGALAQFEAGVRAITEERDTISMEYDTAIARGNELESSLKNLQAQHKELVQIHEALQAQLKIKEETENAKR